MATFATVDDYITYTGSEEQPENLQFLLNRANELVDFRIRQNFKEQNPKHVAAAKNAVCAQVLFWVEANISPADLVCEVGFSLGDLSMEKGSTEAAKPTSICPLAMSYLRSEFLTYKGLYSCCVGQQI